MKGLLPDDGQWITYQPPRWVKTDSGHRHDQEDANLQIPRNSSELDPLSLFSAANLTAFNEPLITSQCNVQTSYVTQPRIRISSTPTPCISKSPDTTGKFVTLEALLGLEQEPRGRDQNPETTVSGEDRRGRSRDPAVPGEKVKKKVRFRRSLSRLSDKARRGIPFMPTDPLPAVEFHRYG
jgi:hypothetical protein